MMREKVVFAAAGVVALSSASLAGGLQNGWRAFRDGSVQDYGYDWATVGRAGNADNVATNSLGATWRLGGVAYRYRIARTEVTNAQYFEFVQAYRHFVDPEYQGRTEFSGTGIAYLGGGNYALPAQDAPRAAEMGWRFAARYVNWLHNGKVDEAWAFESGVYDTSTFGTLPDGTLLDQAERSPGARFFLPTQDEWVKAAHFDPDRYGEGQEGYWVYPTTSDTDPVPGAPGTPGAQTNRGTDITNDIMAYPDVVSPWGLWDTSGGVREWLERRATVTRFIASTDEDTSDFFPLDRIDYWAGALPHNLIGIRLASVVPSPGAGALALAAGAMALGARRRR